MTRILIADDHAVVRSGVRRIIESHAGWTVVAEAADGKEAIDKAIAEIRRLEDVMTTWRPSELQSLNDKNGEWVEVGSLGEGMPPPPKAQGVRASAGRDFGATFGRAIGCKLFGSVVG